MNRQKLKKLLVAARNEAAPAPSPDFAADVLRAVRLEKQFAFAETVSVFDRLNQLFPKLAWAAVTVIMLGVAVDFGLTVTGLPDLREGVSQISSQWLFAGNGF
jgi:hypothetical protein